MIATAQRLVDELVALDVPIFAADRGGTQSHQFAVLAHEYGGGQQAARRLRQANLLTCGIGLPVSPVSGDVNGLRIGTPEIVRLGMTSADMPALASFIARGLDPDADLAAVGSEVTQWRRQFSGVHFTAEHPS
jgi:glycine hydroxymethyltransferase